MNRPTRVQTFMELAHVWSKRATCMRLNVGAVVVIDGTAVSHGYNGAPSGRAHCSGNDCPGKLVCRETTHAEENALMRIPPELMLKARQRNLDDGRRHTTTMMQPRRGPGFDIYVTDSPCPRCAELILEAGVKRVFFATPYRITDALDALIERGVEVYRVTPAGYVIEWETKNVVEM